MQRITSAAWAMLACVGVVLLTASSRVRADDDEITLRAAIISHVKSSGSMSIYVDMMGRLQRAKLLRADAEGLVVRVMGAEMPMRWSGLSPARFGGIASKVVEGKPALALSLARYYASHQMPEAAGKTLDDAAAAGADPAAVAAVKRQIAPLQPEKAVLIVNKTKPKKRVNLPPPGAGLAWKYAADRGIDRDPSVILFEDYEIQSVNVLKKRGWRSGDWSFYDIDATPGVALSGSKCLKKIARTGKGGAIMPRDLKKPVTDALYHRVYVRFPQTMSSVRVMGITGVRDGWPTWKAIGSAGVRPNGTNYYCVTLTCQIKGNKRRFMFYPYHVDQKGNYGDNWIVNAPVPADKWLCVEIMVKLNTPDQKNGELRMWIDGKEVFTKTDLRYRTSDIVKTTMFFDQNYTSQKFAQDFVWYADNRVLATRYIGPMRRAAKGIGRPMDNK